MTDNVVKFYPKDAANNPDNVLEQAIGRYNEVFIIGYNKEDALDVRASMNFSLRDIWFALDAFKHNVMSGKYDHRIDDRTPEGDE